MSDVLQGSTVYPDRISFFTKRKEEWWDLNTPFRYMHQANVLAFDYIKDALQNNYILESDGFRMKREIEILDVGCGGGILAEPLARAGARVVGIDVNKDAIEVAQAHAKLDPCLLKRISYSWESIEDHCKGNIEKYDVVLLNFVLHHAKEHDMLIRHCIQALKPGGIIFLSSLAKTYECWLRVIVLGEMITRCYTRGSFNWNYFINSSDVVQIVEKNKCYVGSIKGMYHDIFSSCWKWDNSMQNLYILHAFKQ